MVGDGKEGMGGGENRRQSHGNLRERQRDKFGSPLKINDKQFHLGIRRHGIKAWCAFWVSEQWRKETVA